jgi:5-methylthioadenosine/S-adenosylhomocysteine deaminase
MEQSFRGDNRMDKVIPFSSVHEPDIIIQGGKLLSMVDGEDCLNNVTVLIKKDKIIDIQSPVRRAYSEGIEVIDASNCLIMPGLINAHTHAAMTIFRGYADDMPLDKWLYEKIFPAEAAHLNPENVYWGSLLSCLEMIASGTTSFIDGYFFQDYTARAVNRSGLRAIIAQGVIDLPAPGVDDPEKNLLKGREFIEKWLDHSDLITPGLFCHSPVTCSEKTLKGAMEISREHFLPMQVHLSETSGEVEEIIKRTGRRPAHYLKDLGLLGGDLIAAHSIHLDDEEIELLSKNGVLIVHVPESNMKLASGVARVTDMLRAGLTVGIGTDGCASNNNLDLFKEMDSAAKMGKVFTKNPVNMDAVTLLKMATSWGAKIMGMENEIGTVQKGKKADIIVIDMNSPHLVPSYDPISTMVYSARGSDVKDVIVNGKILMKNRIFQTLDQEEILGRVNAISRDIKA